MSGLRTCTGTYGGILQFGGVNLMISYPKIDLKRKKKKKRKSVLKALDTIGS